MADVKITSNMFIHFSINKEAKEEREGFEKQHVMHTQHPSLREHMQEPIGKAWISESLCKPCVARNSIAVATEKVVDGPDVWSWGWSWIISEE